MSITDRFNTNLQKAFNEYTESYLGKDGAAFLPTKTEYDIAVNRAAAKVPSQTLEGTFPGMTGKVLGTASDIVMPALAFGSSPFYDMYQASERARDNYGQPDVLSVVDDAEIPMGPSFPEYAKAVADENILSSALGRTAGAGQNLVDRFNRIKGGIGDLVFTRAYAPEITNEERQSIDITNQLNDYYEKGEMMDNVVDAPKSGILENIDFGKLLSFAEILGPTNLRKALAGTKLGSTVSNLFQGGRDRPDFQYRTPGYTGQLIASDRYDPKTGLNRFDRAKTLFGQSRTLMDYIQKKKEQRNRRAANRARVEQAIQNQQDAGGSVQTSDSYSGIGDVGATGANFSGDFATDSASYDL